MKNNLRGLHSEFLQLKTQFQQAEKRAVEAEVSFNAYTTQVDEMSEELTAYKTELAAMRTLLESKSAPVGKSEPMDEAERTILKAYVKACMEESEKAKIKGQPNPNQLQWRLDEGFASDHNRDQYETLTHLFALRRGDIPLQAPTSSLRHTIPEFKENSSAYEDITADMFKKRVKAEKLKQSTYRLTKGVAEEGDKQRKEADDKFKLNAAIKSKMESVSVLFVIICLQSAHRLLWSQFVDTFKVKRKHSMFSEDKYDVFDDYHSHPKIQHIGVKKGKKAYIWPDLVGVYSDLVSFSFMSMDKRTFADYT